ncbi:hypothetical protein CPB86DRAFT_65507 [Serendipita vermifera]|nr:hypothetical protein CPB86DRAFT_65507 [Serendipita vermifera]
MSEFEKKEKNDVTPPTEDYEKHNVTVEHHYNRNDPTSRVTDPNAELYDPYKESIWTRLGLTFESFKRAPGTTGCVFVPFLLGGFFLLGFWWWFWWSSHMGLCLGAYGSLSET